MRVIGTALALSFGLICAVSASAQEKEKTEQKENQEKVIKVTAERSTNLVGKADSATQGTVGKKQLQQRPLLRPGELLETIPGVIVTQHSGSGKANQFFLRGFNLDHGTDLATSIDGMPINMPTHAHGHGYTDLNFVIPELVGGITYRKGSYNAAQGDFSSAGSAELKLADNLSNGLAELGSGSFGFQRFLLANQMEQRNNGSLLYGLELFGYDGPWKVPEKFRKTNALLRYSGGDAKATFSVTGMAYDGKWNSTDQVPQRAIDSGSLDRFGAIDPSDGGKSHRYSLSGNYLRPQGKNAQTQLSAYAIDYQLNLWSNFTYFLDNPVQGDQFEQADKRRVYGLNAAHQIKSTIGGRPQENAFGLQVRHDNISGVGLYSTQQRVRFATTREDKVRQTSVAPYFENRIQLTPKLRTVAGVRYDDYSFKVDSSIAANSGSRHAGLVSPKVTAIYGLHKDTELYVNAGRGFHSNDARGTTITVDPKTGDPAQQVTPLVKANSAELGLRTVLVPGLQSTFSLWQLDLDSELLFVGDAGTTEASRPSRRSGIELTNFWKASKTVTIDADLAYARARFSDTDPAGDRIPGAIEGVAALGVSVDDPSGFSGSLRLRYFGPRPLIEDNSVRSKASTLVNGRLGYRTGKNSQVSLDVFNLLNAKVSDIDYYYASRLPGEAAGGVEGIHTHPAESRSLRLNVSWRL